MDKTPTGDTSSRSSSDMTRKEKLIHSGWELFHGLPLSGVFAGLTAAKVASEAEVTTGSFFHHFPNAAAFADALVLQHADIAVPAPAKREEIAAIGQEWNLDASAVVHYVAGEIWQSHLNGTEYEADMIRVLTLWTHRHAELATPTDRYRTAGDVVLDVIQARERMATDTWRDLLDITHMEFAPGYPVAVAAMVLTALFDGLAIRHAVDPDSVSETIYADIAWIITDAITVPKQVDPFGDSTVIPPGRPGYTGRDTINLSPQAQSGARRRNESKAQVLQHCSDMFGSGWESVTITEIAHQAQVSAQTVINVFGTVRKVAAVSFGQHLGKISLAGSTAALISPEAELLAILESIAESAIRDPGSALALLSERINLNVRPQIPTHGLDVRIEVPLDRLILRPLSDMGLNGQTGPVTADTLINFVLGHAPGRIDAARRTAELAIRLIDLTSSTGDE